MRLFLIDLPADAEIEVWDSDVANCLDGSGWTTLQPDKIRAVSTFKPKPVKASEKSKG
jgi:hypothetical protein